MRRRLIPFVVICVGAAPAARAQLTATPEYQVNGLRAILLTPAAALPQSVPSWDSSAAHPGFALRFGRYSFTSATYSNLAASAWVALASRLHVGGTFGQRTCEGCTGSFMGSVDVDAGLYHGRAKRRGDADTDLGLQLSAGLGKAKEGDFRARSVFAALPLGFTLPQANGTKLSLFVSPGVTYGRMDSAGVTKGALSSVIIGAGAALKFPGGLGAHLAAHRIITGDSPTQLGFALSWTFGLRRPEEP
jgi:hypothetical protein